MVLRTWMEKNEQVFQCEECGIEVLRLFIVGGAYQILKMNSCAHYRWTECGNYSFNNTHGCDKEKAQAIKTIRDGTTYYLLLPNQNQ